MATTSHRRRRTAHHQKALHGLGLTRSTFKATSAMSELSNGRSPPALQPDNHASKVSSKALEPLATSPAPQDDQRISTAQVPSAIPETATSSALSADDPYVDSKDTTHNKSSRSKADFGVIGDTFPSLTSRPRGRTMLEASTPPRVHFKDFNSNAMVTNSSLSASTPQRVHLDILNANTASTDSSLPSLIEGDSTTAVDGPDTTTTSYDSSFNADHPRILWPSQKPAHVSLAQPAQDSSLEAPLLSLRLPSPPVPKVKRSKDTIDPIDAYVNKFHTSPLHRTREQEYDPFAHDFATGNEAAPSARPTSPLFDASAVRASSPINRQWCSQAVQSNVWKPSLDPLQTREALASPSRLFDWNSSLLPADHSLVATEWPDLSMSFSVDHDHGSGDSQNDKNQHRSLHHPLFSTPTGFAAKEALAAQNEELKARLLRQEAENRRLFQECNSMSDQVQTLKTALKGDTASAVASSAHGESGHQETSNGLRQRPESPSLKYVGRSLVEEIQAQLEADMALRSRTRRQGTSPCDTPSPQATGSTPSPNESLPESQFQSAITTPSSCTGASSSMPLQPQPQPQPQSKSAHAGPHSAFGSPMVIDAQASQASLQSVSPLAPWTSTVHTGNCSTPAMPPAPTPAATFSPYALHAMAHPYAPHGSLSTGTLPGNASTSASIPPAYPGLAAPNIPLSYAGVAAPRFDDVASDHHPFDYLQHQQHPSMLDPHALHASSRMTTVPPSTPLIPQLQRMGLVRSFEDVTAATHLYHQQQQPQHTPHFPPPMPRMSDGGPVAMGGRPNGGRNTSHHQHQQSHGHQHHHPRASHSLMNYMGPEALIGQTLSGRSQEGSIILQQQLKSGTADRQAAILRALAPHLAVLSEDKHGNFLVQRAIGIDARLCSELKGHFVRLAVSTYGCHVVQRVLDEDESIRMQVVEELLAENLLDTLTCRNSVHVWAKALETKWSSEPFRRRLYATINAAMKGRWACTAMQETGSIVVQNLFESADEDEKEDCVSEILDRFTECVANQWGVWVAQHIIEYGSVEDRKAAFEKLLAEASALSLSQYGCKAVMTALKTRDEGFVQGYIDRLCGPGTRPCATATAIGDEDSGSKVNEGALVRYSEATSRARTGSASEMSHPGGRGSMLVEVASTPQGLQIMTQLLTTVSRSDRERIIAAVRKNSVFLKGSKSGLKVHQMCERARAFTGY
ncbi:unnamed protein product [Sympodiomycopsis kandeliae]